jgi:capsule polysaccharide export protein KpsE/RkpR
MTGQRNTIYSGGQPVVELQERNTDPTRHEPSFLLNCAAMLWRDRTLLARIAAAGGLLTLLIAFLVPNRYESSTRLMSPEMGSSTSQMLMTGLLNRTGGLAGLGANLLGLDNTGAMFIGVLNSRTVADNLVQRFDLKKVYGARRDQDARLELAAHTTFSEDRKSEIITISVEDVDPHRAAALAAAYIDELNNLLVQVNTSSAHRERVFIEDRLKFVKPELDLATKQLSDFSTRTTTLDLKEQGKTMVEAVASLQGELMANQTQLHGLEQIYSSNNVRIRSLQARIAEQRRQLDSLRGSAVEPPPVTGDGDDSDFPSFRRLPALGVTYTDLYREVKLREAVFETLTQQFEMAKIAEAKETPSVKVLDLANLPDKKSGPHRGLITLLGVMVSFGLGMVFVIGRGTWRRVDPDDPRKVLAAEIWGDTRPARSGFRARARKIKNRLWRNSNSTSDSDRKVDHDS